MQLCIMYVYYTYEKIKEFTLMNCHRCGTPLSANEIFCPKCGEKTQPTTSDYTTVCPVCETIHTADCIHCSVCGSELPKYSPDRNYGATVFCVNCGTENPAENNCCAKCGNPLSSTPPGPGPKPSNSLVPIIIVLCAVATLCLIVVGILIGTNDRDRGDDTDGSTPTPVITATPEPIPEITREPTPMPTPIPTPVPTPVPTPYPIEVHNPTTSYRWHTDTGYSFSCPYPSGFYETVQQAKFARLSLSSYNNCGTMFIGATVNDNGRTVDKVSENFKSSYQHTKVIYDQKGSNYCSVLITNGYHYNYCYYNLSSGMIRGFEMQFDSACFDEYMTYAQYMQNNMRLY